MKDIEDKYTQAAETRTPWRKKSDPDCTNTCDGCNYPFPMGGVKECNDRQGEHKFCELCACTLIGNAAKYPGQYPNQDVLRTIGWIANLFRSKLKV